MNFNNGLDILEGDVVLVDKPYEWTSFDLVKKVRYRLQHKFDVKKIKVGHAGTLDPLATGLVIINTGRMTKKINEYQAMNKTYVANITFGSSTPSFDLETTPDKFFDTGHINQEYIQTVLHKFLGEQEQYPPVYSAKRVNGNRAYEFARKGKEVTLQPSVINIEKLKINKFEDNNLILEVVCSKGTYIRSLAHDLGIACSSGAHLSGLRRIAIGHFNVSDALDIENLEKTIDNL